jgi:hypothetical protein
MIDNDSKRCFMLKTSLRVWQLMMYMTIDDYIATRLTWKLLQNYVYDLHELIL